jgi:hypothetical protein
MNKKNYYLKQEIKKIIASITTNINTSVVKLELNVDRMKKEVEKSIRTISGKLNLTIIKTLYKLIFFST